MCKKWRHKEQNLRGGYICEESTVVQKTNIIITVNKKLSNWGLEMSGCLLLQRYQQSMIAQRNLKGMASSLQNAYSQFSVTIRIIPGFCFHHLQFHSKKLRLIVRLIIGHASFVYSSTLHFPSGKNQSS